MSPVLRIALLAAGLILLFAGTVAVLMRVMPGPHKETDYLVMGGMATLVTMLALFVILVTTLFRGPDTFFRKRKKD